MPYNEPHFPRGLGIRRVSLEPEHGSETSSHGMALKTLRPAIICTLRERASPRSFYLGRLSASSGTLASGLEVIVPLSAADGFGSRFLRFGIACVVYCEAGARSAIAAMLGYCYK
jgi:hypothetical protein